MKLYTEEQVKKAMSKKLEFPNDDIEKFYSDDEIIESLTPIQLLSDEEIKEHFSWGYGGDSGSAIYGAKWMKEQILNQNK